MTTKIYVFWFFIFCFITIETTAQTEDAFQQIMNKLGINESNLGFKPKGYWTRYPISTDIPYKNIAFDDLFAEPHRIYDFVRNMALSVEDFLHPEYMKNSKDGIMKLGYYCGVNNITSQFRAYNASLWAEIDSLEPLLQAIKEIYMSTNSIWRYHRIGEAADFPLVEKDYREAIKTIHPEVQKIVAKTIIHLISAYRFRQIGMRNVDWKKAASCWRIRHLGETQFDGMGYYSDLEDCAKAIDMNSIYYSGLILMESSQKLADSLINLKKTNKKIDWKNQNLNINTPIGRIVISGTGVDEHQYTDAILVIDLGGNDVYKGCVGGTYSLDMGISLHVDLEGNDSYINEDEYIVSQGGAIFGAAMLLDISGNDRYISKRLSQGGAMLGFGILADIEGDDYYDLWTDGQGAAYFGVGLAIDGKGNDKYRLWGDGQGYGGVGGVGVLINRTGNDHYWAEKDVNKVYRPDLHSKDKEHNYTYCQGSGVGRRGDVTDGHSWAGGMGVLIDIDGDDLYESGNWSQGCGYWYGMGFLYDGNGNDKYISTTWSQACGAHFCIGGLFDDGGDDEFQIWENWASGMGFGHDYTISIFYNNGGNDKYKLKDDGLGYAINKSQVFFIDTEGNDIYTRGTKGRNYGWNNFTQNNPPPVEFLYHLYSDQICVFADLKGDDKYFQEDFETKKTNLDSLMKNDFEWFAPNTEELKSLDQKKYYGIGKDFGDYEGRVPEYFRFKMKKRYEFLEK